MFWHILRFTWRAWSVILSSNSWPPTHQKSHQSDDTILHNLTQSYTAGGGVWREDRGHAGRQDSRRLWGGQDCHTGEGIIITFIAILIMIIYYFQKFSFFLHENIHFYENLRNYDTRQRIWNTKALSRHMSWLAMTKLSWKCGLTVSNNHSITLWFGNNENEILRLAHFRAHLYLSHDMYSIAIFLIPKHNPNVQNQMVMRWYWVLLRRRGPCIHPEVQEDQLSWAYTWGLFLTTSPRLCPDIYSIVLILKEEN